MYWFSRAVVALAVAATLLNVQVSAQVDDASPASESEPMASNVSLPNKIGVISPAVSLLGEQVELKVTLSWPNVPYAQDKIPYTVYDFYDPTHVYVQGAFNKSNKDGELQREVALESFVFDSAGAHYLSVHIGDPSQRDTSIADSPLPDATIQSLYGWLTLPPIILPILIALLTKHVFIALFYGTFLSSVLINYFNPLLGFLRATDRYMVKALSDPDHTKVLLFTWFLAGLIALIQRSGGAEGLAQLVIKWATTRWRGLWVAFVMGMVIFFDDFASCLIVGVNMVQVSDLLSISREKLAFFVHATSSPLASIVPVSSWVGYEVGLINDELKKLGSDADAFVILLKTIVSRFYPIFMIVLLIALNLLKRDFGPMLRAERRAFHEGKVAPDMTVSTSKPSGFRIGDKLKSAFRRIIGIFKKHSDNQANALVEEKTLRPSMTEHELRAMENALPESDTICTEAVFENVVRPVKDKPRRWYNAVVPIFIHVLLVVLGIFLTGYYTTKELKLLGEEVEFDAATLAGNGDSYGALIYAAVFSSIFSIIFYKVQSILTVSDSLAHWTFGVKDIFEPVLILIMAWSIGSALNEIRAAHFIAGILNGSLHPGLLPTVVFLTACIISFVTGTSWGTMAILFPLAVPLASAVRPDNEEIIVETIASILSGSIFGDQCSLISGTSVISALASKCPLAAHVTTQLPYALVVAFISVLCGYLPVGYGLYPPGVAILIGTIFIFAFVFIFGSKVEEVKDEKESSLLGRIRNGMSSLRKLFGDKK